LVAKVDGTEALKIIAKETAMSIKDAGAFVNDLVRGRGFGNVRAIGRLKVNKLAEANITNSGKTVLGKHIEGGGYIKKAQDTGSSYFDNGNKWDKLSPKQRWNANKHFLDKISAKGDEINLSTPKGKIIKGKYLDKEINYAPASLILIAVSLAMILSASVPSTFATKALTPLSNTAPSASEKSKAC
jgi:hypothetical protein